jgi:NAD-dependent SIR2 family protein deacetylase
MPFVLTVPKKISEGALSKQIVDVEWGMCFDCSKEGKGFTLEFYYKFHKTSLRLRWFGNLDYKLEQNTLSKFSIAESNTNGQSYPIYSFIYGDVYAYIDAHKEDIVEPYHLYTPVDYKVKQNPMQIKIFSALLNIMSNQNVIFYTGAGLSVGRVPMMGELLNEIELPKSADRRAVSHFVQNVLSKPNMYAEKMDVFYNRCLLAEPSLGHYALTFLALQKSTNIFTENLDLLHIRTGYEASMPSFKGLQVEEEMEQLKRVDAVICIGLSHDDRGFLGWYKHLNPTGKIVSINPDPQPASYLGSGDYHMVADAQEILSRAVTFLWCDKTIKDEQRYFHSVYKIESRQRKNSARMSGNGT